MRKIFSVIAGRFFPKIVLFFFPLFIGLNLNGQNLELDSTRIVEVNANAEKVHSPKKATLYSAVLPGLGQAYNKKYWKIPVIYAGFAGIGYFIHWNSGYYNTMKLAYSDLTDGNDETNSYLDLEAAHYYDLEDPTDFSNFKKNLVKTRDYYRRNRELLVISMVAFFGLNIIDESVDAHLFDFDIREYLSFNWQPNMQNYNRQTVYGLNCTFTF